MKRRFSLLRAVMPRDGAGSRPVGLRQGGAVLVMAMIMLLVLTFLGLSVSGVSIMETKMARNNYEQNLAFQVAEAALLDAEAWLRELPLTPTTGLIDAINPATDVYNAGVVTGYSDQQFIELAENGVPYGTGSGVLALNQDIAGTAAPTYAVAEMVIGFGDGRSIDGRDSLNVGSGPVDRKTFYLVTAQHSGRIGTTQKVVQSVFIRR